MISITSFLILKNEKNLLVLKKYILCVLLESEPVTIDLQMDNIVKIMAFYGEKQPFIIIYTDHLAAVGIQCLLNMNEDNKKHFYNPLSKGEKKFFSFSYLSLIFL